VRLSRCCVCVCVCSTDTHSYAGLVFSRYRAAITPQNQEFVHHIWQNLAYIANTVIFVMSGVIVAKSLFFEDEFGARDFANLLMLYVAVHVARGLAVCTHTMHARHITLHTHMLYYTLHIYTPFTHTHTHPPIHTRTHTHTYTHVHTHAHTQTHAHTHIHAHTHTHTHTRTHTYVYTNAHTPTHTHI